MGLWNGGSNCNKTCFTFQLRRFCIFPVPSLLYVQCVTASNILQKTFQASLFNNVLLFNRRKTPRHLCRLKSRAWERTTSASWRNPTAPPPSSRSSPSGCSTPSTWTESRPPAARFQVLHRDRSQSEAQSAFSLAPKQKNMLIYKNKNTTWTVDGRFKILQTSANHGLADVPVDLWPRHHQLWLDGGKGASVGIRHCHLLAACTPSPLMLQFVSMWWVVGAPAWQTTCKMLKLSRKEGSKPLFLVGSPANLVPMSPYAEYRTPLQRVLAARRLKHLGSTEPRQRGVWNSCCLHFVLFFFFFFKFRDNATDYFCTNQKNNNQSYTSGRRDATPPRLML